MHKIVEPKLHERIILCLVTGSNLLTFWCLRLLMCVHQADLTSALYFDNFQEIDELCDEWVPAPLIPKMTDEMRYEPPILER